MTRSRSIYAKFLIALLALSGAGTAFAQYGYAPDSGYNAYYHEGNATAERARSWGYQDGLADGQKDRMTGHSFRPTHDDRYEDAPDHGNHAGMSRQQYKDIYRDAYVHGYERGYGR